MPKRILSNPPHRLAQKAVRKLFGRIEYSLCKLRDFKKCTRISKNIPLINKHLLELPDLSEFPQETFRFLADKYLNHQFDLLGSGWKTNNMEKRRDREEAYLPAHLQKNKTIWTNISPDYLPIDWQKDYKSGFRWDTRKWYKEQRSMSKPGADIKVPWELARMQHLPQLAFFACRLPEKKNQLVMEFKNQVLDFIAANPPRMGVNWVCTMDVAIRAANLLLAYDLFTRIDEGASLDIPFKQIFANSVYEHGLHIMNNLEWGTRLNSNHYLSDIAGLFFIACYLPDSCKKKKKWFQFALSELQKEITLQIYDDGTDYEASTGYHRLVLELFFYPVFLGVRNSPYFDGKNYLETAEQLFGRPYLDRLYKMLDAVHVLLKPNGQMPQIGDNDSGQFIKLFARPVLDMRYLLALGAVFFKESTWKIREFFQTEEDVAELVILFGQYGKEIWGNLADNSLENIRSRAFPDSGWYVMRSRRNYCLVSCGPNGIYGRGSHGHNDKLGFELFLDGKDILVDPGTYLYTPEPQKRNQFRGTAIHNTVIIDGQEQNRLKKHLFSLENDALPHSLKWEVGTEMDTFIGEHYGYRRLQNPVTHQREFQFFKNEGKLVLIDRFQGSGEHDLKWSLVLHPSPEAKIKIHSSLVWEETGGWFSPSYGHVIPTRQFEAKTIATLPLETTIEICLE